MLIDGTLDLNVSTLVSKIIMSRLNFHHKVKTRFNALQGPKRNNAMCGKTLNRGKTKTKH